MTKYGWFRIALALGLVSCLAPGALAQKKYTFKDVNAPGDSSQVTDRMNMALEIVVEVPGSGTQTLKFSQKKGSEYSQVVLATDAKGISSMRRVYTLDSEEEQDPEGAVKKKVSSLQGKTVTAKRVGTKVTVTIPKGKLTADDEKEVAKSMTRKRNSFFPKSPVAIGDTWDVDPEFAKEMFAGVEKVAVAGKLEELVDFQGRSCARVSLKIDASGKAGNSPIPMSFKLAGNVYYALDLERPVLLELKGPITISGESEENGAKIKFTGSGTMDAKMSQKFDKVGGKKP